MTEESGRASLRGAGPVALVLDAGHRVLVEGRRALALARRAADRRPLVALRESLAAVGVDVDQPLGARPLGSDASDQFVFVVDRAASSAPLPSGWSWVPLRDLARDTDDADAAWALYVDVVLGGAPPPSRSYDVFSFGDRPEMAARLAHLVFRGDKRATAGWLRAADRSGEPVPIAGLVSLVTDGFGVPCCFIETERVDHLRFRDVEPEFALAEGEGDRTLDDWVAGHRAYFNREAARLGLVFTDDEVVFLERFRVIARL